jgi:phage gp29-like protein
MARRKYSKDIHNPKALADAVVNAYEEFATNPNRINEAVQKYIKGVQNADFNAMEMKLAMWYEALDEANIPTAFSQAMTQAKAIYKRRLEGMTYNVQVQGGIVVPAR